MIRSYNRIVVLLAVTLVAASVVGAGSMLPPLPADHRIVIDGDTSEWEGVELHYFEEGIRTVAVAHDADHLYVMWRFGDVRLARRVLARGVTVWVNGDGKKKETVGIRYPGSALIAEALAPVEGDQKPPGMDEGVARRMRRQFTMREPGFVTILDGEVETDLPEDNQEGPVAASAVYDGVFSYEVRIPFVTVGGKVASQTAEADRKVAVGFQVGGLSPEEHEALQDQMREIRLGDGTGGGMGGGLGGGRPGGGGMGGPPGAGSRMGEQEIEWLKIKLAPVRAASS